MKYILIAMLSFLFAFSTDVAFARDAYDWNRQAKRYEHVEKQRYERKVYTERRANRARYENYRRSYRNNSDATSEVLSSAGKSVIKKVVSSVTVPLYERIFIGPRPVHVSTVACPERPAKLSPQQHAVAVQEYETCLESQLKKNQSMFDCDCLNPEK